MLINKWLTISNLLTLSRIILTPFIVYGIASSWWILVFVLLMVAGITDVLDGYFARKFSQKTFLGTSLDPIADKILLVSCFTALSFIDSPSFSIPYWFIFIIFFRETLILGGSLFLLLFRVNFTIAPSLSGKLTTFFQLNFILWIFICYFVGWNPVKTYSALLVFITIVSLISLGQYSLIGVKYLTKNKGKENTKLLQLFI
jgi:cardiolipin synthase (CMP-forming)